jgi:hypothetical protein
MRLQMRLFDMRQLMKATKYLLIGWSIVCTASMTLFIALIFCKLTFGNAGSDIPAAKSEVRHLLNWCRLDSERIDAVLHSHVSPRSFSGDHLDAHAVRLTHIDEQELKLDESEEGWFRCDQLSGALKDAVDFAAASLPSKEVPWFPSEKELKSQEMRVWSWTIRYHGTRVTDAELIFVRPKDKMLFFISVKT